MGDPTSVGISWGPVGAVAVILGLIELVRYALGNRSARKNGIGGFASSDRTALHSIAHTVATDAWSDDLHELLISSRKAERILSRMDDRMKFRDERMIEHFQSMECMRTVVSDLKKPPKP